MNISLLSQPLTAPVLLIDVIHPKRKKNRQLKRNQSELNEITALTVPSQVAGFYGYTGLHSLITLSFY